jgi:tetratricopeptide (TPR) repeat protein/nucleoside phosphorylase
MEEHNQSCDVCIVCALYEEASAVLDEFSARCDVSFTRASSRVNGYTYQYTTIRNKQREPLTVLVTWLTGRGPIQIGLDLNLLLHEFRPRFVAMAGICAGDKGKVKLGDLVVAQYAYDYEEGKIVRELEGSSRHLPEIKTADLTSQVFHYVRSFDGWKEPVREMKRHELNYQLTANEEPRCVVAPMASGMVVRGDDPFPWLREKYNRNTVALDMEAATFYRVLRGIPHMHALVVKGVCDYADIRKNDAYRDYAARVSAIYILSFIQEYVTEHAMPRRDALLSTNQMEPSVIWNVPYARNPHFTGRDDLLDRLHQQLVQDEQHNATTNTRRAALTQPQAIKGLGGIGKTQVAIEYIYRYSDHYPYVLWINAATEETLISSFAAIAKLLPSFPANDEMEPRKLVEKIKQWLEQCEKRWLLVLDNADDLSLVRDSFPQHGKGSVLLTTRASFVAPIAASLEVEKMGLIEGTQFLLRRARFAHASDEEVNEAGNIVIALDFLPLALDQAGAYIEETQCSLSDYLHLYQTHRKEVLARRGLHTSYPDAVATTWSLSFQKVEQANPAASELLRLCAFLAPDAIPEELLRDGAPHWSFALQKAVVDPFTFDQMIAEVLKFSLMKRSVETKTLSIHRLVQVVLLDTMEEDEQRQRAERVIRAVNEVSPLDTRDAATWPQCLRYLNQVQACDNLIERYALMFNEAADLLHRTGIYLYEHALYAITEPLFQQALHIREQSLGSDHPSVAALLNDLAELYRTQEKYEQAEPLFLLALHILEQSPDSDHPNVTYPLKGLARLYFEQGKYERAELLFQRALHIRELALGPDHLNVAHLLNDLAELYFEQGKYERAELLFQRALHIRELALGPDHLDVTPSLNGLAKLYRDRGRYAEAEPLFLRTLHIQELALGPDHPNVASLLNNLATLYTEQGKYVEAEPLYQRALHIWEEKLGPEHSHATYSLNGLADLYTEQGKYMEAEPLYQRALHIREQVLGSDHPYVATSLNGLADLYTKQGKYMEAEPLYQRILHIREQVLGSDHPDTASSLNNLAALYQIQGKYMEAEPLYQRALHIREQVLGSDHPYVATSLNGLADLYTEQGKYMEAEPLYQRALHIREQVLGSDHPNTASSLNNLAALYQIQGKYVEAEPLYHRALKIDSQIFGGDHPAVATDLNNLAQLYYAQAKYKEAERLFRGVLAIFTRSFGSAHPEISAALNNLASVLQATRHFSEAEAFYKQALAIDRLVFGPDHTTVATDLNNLATIYAQTNRLQEAEDCYRQALTIDERLFGTDHPVLGVRLHNLAVILLVANRVTEAKELLQRVDRLLSRARSYRPSLLKEVKERLEALR